MAHWLAAWKTGKAKEKNEPRVMNASEEIVWLRENVLKKGPKDNAPYADAAKRLAELYAQNYPGVEEQD
jgi:hypothetical protein